MDVENPVIVAEKDFMEQSEALFRIDSDSAQQEQRQKYRRARRRKKGGGGEFFFPFEIPEEQYREDQADDSQKIDAGKQGFAFLKMESPLFGKWEIRQKKSCRSKRNQILEDGVIISQEYVFAQPGLGWDI